MLTACLERDELAKTLGVSLVEVPGGFAAKDGDDGGGAIPFRQAYGQGIFDIGEIEKLLAHLGSAGAPVPISRRQNKGRAG